MKSRLFLRRTRQVFVAGMVLAALALPAAASKDVPPAPMATKGIPTNDNFVNRQSVLLPFSTTITDAQMATVEVNEDLGTCVGAMKHTVWYTITIPEATVTITTPGTSYDGQTDTFVNVYEGSGSLGSLTPVACNDDNGPIGSARLEVSLDAGRGVSLHLRPQDSAQSAPSRFALRRANECRGMQIPASRPARMDRYDIYLRLRP